MRPMGRGGAKFVNFTPTGIDPAKSLEHGGIKAFRQVGVVDNQSFTVSAVGDPF